MNNKPSRAVTVAEAIIALPLLYLLWVLAIEFIAMYGLVVVPVGVAVYLVISLIVDRFFLRQSTQLEQALARKLAFVGEKPRYTREDR